MKRIRTAERNRLYNKSRKSAVATRMKKVFVKVNELMKETTVTDELIVPVEKLVSEAYQEIDKAVSKGVLHKNTGARRKSRLGLMKKKLLISAGLYKPE